MYKVMIKKMIEMSILYGFDNIIWHASWHKIDRCKYFFFKK